MSIGIDENSEEYKQAGDHFRSFCDLMHAINDVRKTRPGPISHEQARHTVMHKLGKAALDDIYSNEPLKDYFNDISYCRNVYTDRIDYAIFTYNAGTLNIVIEMFEAIGQRLFTYSAYAGGSLKYREVDRSFPLLSEIVTEDIAVAIAERAVAKG